jgi:branched-chain amino acid aminotransferase
VLLDVNGNISEGPGFNIFAVEKGTVSTPDLSVLLGVTRETVFDLCAEMGIPCHARDIPVESLRRADEVFITSTAGGVMPVSKIDGHPVGSGEVGKLTRQMMARYWQLHEDEKFRKPISYPSSDE